MLSKKGLGIQGYCQIIEKFTFFHFASLLFCRDVEKRKKIRLCQYNTDASFHIFGASSFEA
jgi:hypothetical protein